VHLAGMVDNGDGWHDIGFETQHLQQGVGEYSEYILTSDVIDVDKENNSSQLDFGDPPDSEEDDSEGYSIIKEPDYGCLTYQIVKANCEEMCLYVQKDQQQLAELKLFTDRVMSS
jgi:hypothetical protein